MSDLNVAYINNGDDFPLTADEVIGVVLSLFTAGFASVSAAIWSALLQLARDTPLRRTLCADTDQIPAFVDKILRLEPPAPTIRRVTTREVLIRDIAIPADSRVWLCVEAADREDSGDDMTLSIDGTVRRHRHLGFGAGPHQCIGSSLARIEIEALIGAWLDRIPEFEVEPGFTPSISHEEEGPTSLTGLPLRWGGYAVTSGVVMSETGYQTWGLGT